LNPLWFEGALLRKFHVSKIGHDHQAGRRLPQNGSAHIPSKTESHKAADSF
jgi:hypothetical protein